MLPSSENQREATGIPRDKLKRYSLNTVKLLGTFLGLSLVLGAGYETFSVLASRQDAEDIGTCLDAMGNPSADSFIINLSDASLTAKSKGACSRALGISGEAHIDFVAVNPNVMRADQQRLQRNSQFDLFPDPIVVGATGTSCAFLLVGLASLTDRRRKASETE